MRYPRSCACALGNEKTEAVPTRQTQPGDQQERVRRWIRPELLASERYDADRPGSIRLDAMENPYPLPEPLRRQWLQSLQSVAVNRYPDGRATRLRQTLRRVLEIPPALELMLGNGSDELILLISLALTGPERKALAPDPSFIVYRQAAGIAGLEYLGVPLSEAGFALDTDRMLEQIKRHRPALVWLAWPNNPTGNLYPEADVLRVIRQAPGVVVVDEAYYPYSRRSLLQAAQQHGHLLVLRTLSKLGMAGLRIGILIGSPIWIEQLEKLRLPYNLSSLVQAGAECLLAGMELFDHQVRQICDSRQSLYQDLKRLPGLEVWPSETNFLLLRLLQADADQVHAGLQQRGILVKNVHHTHPLLRQCLRVSIGTAEENRQLLSALDPLLNGRSPAAGGHLPG